MNSRSQSDSLGVADWLVSTAKRNPEGLLLLAAGAALLARTPRTAQARDSVRRTDQVAQAYEGAGESAWNDTRSDAARSEARSWPGRAQTSDAMETARQTAADMGDRVSDVGRRVSDTASSYATSVSRFASESTRNVARRSGELYGQGTDTLQSAVQRVLREQPLMVALAGVAAGAAIAAVFPRTDIEERTLGPAGERITDFAAEKADQIKKAGMAAGEHLMSSAEQRGLSAEGLKDMARGAADTFGRTMSEPGAGSGPAGGREGSGSGSGFGSQPGGREDMERLE